MRTTSVFMISALVALAVISANARAGKDKAGFIRVAPEEVAWADRPGYEGVKFATIYGDPSKPGLYIVRARFSPGTMTKPHWHPEDRHVVVVSGTWYTGEGDDFDPDKTVPLKPGSYMMHPARAHHYDGAKDEEVIVQIVGIGPSNTTMVHPELGHTGRSLKRP